MDFSLLMRLLKALDEHGVDYVLVGGAALNLLGVLRATEDADIFVRPEPDNIERLKQALRSVWDDPEIDQINSEELCGDYPSVRYGPPSGDLTLDILTRLGEAFAYSELEARVIEVQGIRVRCATPRMLYRMKIDTVRPKDHLDAAALSEAFPQEFDTDVS